MIVPNPKGVGLRKALTKFHRLNSRGARPRTLRRLAARIRSLEADFMDRLYTHQAEKKLLALFSLIDLAKREQEPPA